MSLRCLWPIVLLAVLAVLNLAFAHKIPLARRSFATHRHPGKLARHASTDADTTLARRSVESDLLFSSSSILAPMQIGTPAQQVYVLLDTSSADLAVFGPDYAQQLSSDNSSAVGPAFQTAQSTTYKASGKSFRNDYGSGASATFFVADDATDTIGFRSLTLTGQPVGVVQRGNVSYGSTASGIMGLAFEAASLGLRATPPLQQLVFSNALKTPVFSFALMRPSAESEKPSEADVTQPGGIFTMGLLDGDQYEGEIGWSDVVSTTEGSDAPHKWLSKLDGITVNGRSVPDTDGIVANFDTGSSVTRGSERLLDAILAQANGVYKDADGSYYVPCGETVAPAFNMTISMGGVRIAVEPLDMLFKTAQLTADDGSTYCYSTLTPTGSTEYDLQIGDDVMRSMFVAFSFSPLRVGIAAQSTNVRNQGAVPGYAFSKTRPIATSTMAQPQASGFTRVTPVVVAAAASATSHVSAIGSESIRVGGTYVADEPASMMTVRATSTPPQIGTVETQAATNAATDGVSRDAASASGKISVDVALASRASSTAALSAWTVALAAAVMSTMLVSS